MDFIVNCTNSTGYIDVSEEWSHYGESSVLIEEKWFISSELSEGKVSIYSYLCSYDNNPQLLSSHKEQSISINIINTHRSLVETGNQVGTGYELVEKDRHLLEKQSHQ